MKIALLVVPYDSGALATRMGAGPRRLLDLGLATRLERAGHEVSIAEVLLPTPLPEIASAFALAAALAAAVRDARRRGAFPLVLSGNCNSCLGTVPGLADSPSIVPSIGVAWFDAHADFNTPETSMSGFLDGMAVATLLGDCWTSLARAIPGFTPLPTGRVVLVGARDLDPLEQTRIRDRALRLLPVSRVEDEVEGVARQCWAETEGSYIHIDLDVLDPGEGRANTFAARDGLSLTQLQRTLTAMAAVRPIRAAAITAYDPAVDSDGRAGKSALELAEHVVAFAAAAPAQRPPA